MVRIKHRYLSVHILSPNQPQSKPKTIPSTEKTLPDVVQFHSPIADDLTPQILVGAIRDQVKYLYGDYGLGLASSGLVVKYLSPATATAIIRCPRNHYRLVWAALSFMTQLPSTPGLKQSRACVMQVVRVSGTIRKAEEEVIRRARAAILKANRDEKESGGDGFMGLLGGNEEATFDPKDKIGATSDPSDYEDDMATDSGEDG